MSVELEGNELQAVWDAGEYFLVMRAQAKRVTMEQKLRDATLLLLMERIRVALDAQTKAAVLEVTARLSKTKGEA